ncbi:Periplasmic polysaccharide export protein [Ignavibacterium album JCM 16511]|uniref:Periplasmic polysaccharide export protein n=1 Tax=Ignavibacterium album (strain DSM 19864 / JCM 16511 / NBRC 101810 / Mat9-16) TaxID=945713 RepID=I0AME9_IGNAJ|nr:polysaccharide biosynthesis/export family protein [Ignavibacterium album]AFH50156.1 Periplasmic polysaccharide export protein [Ignavibacterium album JCM 16511]
MKNLFLVFIVLIVVNTNSYGQILNPGDGVRIIFYNINDNISGDYYIQQDGLLQLPFIGNIDTRNRDFKFIKNQIVSKYDSLYKNPELTVQPLLRINILGEVRNPGYYYVTDVEKITGILALAGGVTGAAASKEIYILRGDEEIELNVSELTARGNTAADFGLRSGDRIFVPRSFWADASQYAIIFSGIAVLSTVIALLIRK